MTGRIKLLLLLGLAGIVNLSADDAHAKQPRARPKPPEQKQIVEPPPAPGRQYFATKPIEPLTPEIEQQLKPRDSFKECESCPEMVVIPKGTFMMGTPTDEPYRMANEGPQHRVTIPRPIAVGRFTITFDEWDACVADGGCTGKGDDRGLGRIRMPANGVTFEGAKAYLAWLSKKVGRTYRLPSEAEREYFARAGTTTPFWFGKTISAQNANYEATNNYPGGPYGASSKGPKPVDAYMPNKFGLYQVAGNAEEWVADCYNKYFNPDAPTDGSPWLEGDCNKRILRGGGWMSPALAQRSGYRNDMNPEAGYSFRVVRNVQIQ